MLKLNPFSKQNVYCKRVKCLDKYLKKQKHLNAYDENKFYPALVDRIDQFSNQHNADLKYCEFTCQQKCDQNCKEEEFLRFSKEECITKQDENPAQINQIQGIRTYEACLEKNLINNFQEGSDSYKDIQCKKKCASEQIQRQIQQTKEDCGEQKCFQKVLICLDECEAEYCDNLWCLPKYLQIKNQNIITHLQNTCLELVTEIFKPSNDLCLECNNDIPMRIAAQLVSCSRSQERVYQKQDNNDAYKLFQCTKQCASKPIDSIILKLNLLLFITLSTFILL